jgi:hypothetical protein
MMSHPMEMSLSMTGWAVDPELLDDIRIELIHSEMTGDALCIKLIFKSGREAVIQGELAEGTGSMTYVQLVAEISTPTKKVIEHEG